MSHPTPSPFDPADYETLAAFIDGALGGAERDAVVTRLAKDEDFYEVYVETLHLLEAEAPTPANEIATSERPSIEPHATGSPSKTGTNTEAGRESNADEHAYEDVRFETPPSWLRRTWRFVSPALGVAAVVLIGLGSWRLVASASTWRAQEFLERLEQVDNPEAASLDGGFEWSVMRGAENVPPWLSTDAVALRGASYRLRLERALRIGDVKEAERMAYRLEDHVDAVDRAFPYLERIADVVREGDPGEIDAVLDRAERFMLDTAATGYRLGLWTQTCAWAVDSGDVEFFGKASRRQFQKLTRDHDPRHDAVIATIEQALRRGVTTTDLPALGRACRILGTEAGDAAAP